MAVKTFAAIDVGSYELAMKIFEFSAKNGMKEIDHIRHRIELGTDTYLTGKISHERVDELCLILNEFAVTMKSYKVDSYKAYGTSAIRETENTMIVIEQIKLRTGLKVEVLSNSEQRFLHYKAVASRGGKFDEVIKKGCAIVDVGGGSIQISLFDKERLVTTQNVRLGILRMRDMLVDLKLRTNNYEQLLEELIDNQLGSFKRLYLKGRDIQNIIIVDDYISYIMQKIGGEQDTITTGQFSAFESILHTKTPEQIAKSLGMAEESASLLPPSASLIKRILKLTKAELLWAPGVSLSDGIAYEYGEKERLIRSSHDFENDILACAGNMSKRYMGNVDRNRIVEKVAVELFDGTKKIHGMGRRERLLIRIAALLGDCGKYMSLEEGAECSYSIIMATEMIGLSHAEREIVANVVKFNKARFEYFEELASSALVERENYLKIAKLTALFRVADGICRSYRTKVQGIKLQQKPGELIITVDTAEDITLEQGFFARKAAFFEEVFSIQPILKYKKKLSTI